MSIQHPTLRAELLYLAGRATAPLSSHELYERSELADDVIQVSKALHNLCEQGKLVRAPGEGRARYTLAAGVAAPAPAGKAGRNNAVRKDDVARAGLVKLPTKPLQAPAAVLCGDVLSSARTLSPKTPMPAVSAAHLTTPEPTQTKAEADATLADAILARLKRDLSPLFVKPVVSDLDITTAPGAIHIRVDRVEINISVGVQP